MTTQPADRSHDDDAPARGSVSARAFGRDRRSVLEREKEEFGGIKVGSAFFGWLTATGIAVLLTALVAAAGTAVGLAADTDVQEAASTAADDATTIGLVGGIALGVVIFLAYFCGGYVAGRMARFDGAKQGLAVWLWALAMAIVVAILGAIAGDSFDVLARVNTFPRIPINEGDLTTAGLVAALVIAGVSLVAAVLGGTAGMRYHRRVDRVGLVS